MSVRVLVIDDSLAVRKQVARALIPAGFSVIEACDGIDAFEKLETATDVQLIICDLNMPRMNGMQFLEKKRGDPRYEPIPVLVLTTEGQTELVEEAKALGAKAWMVKPFVTTLLVVASTKLSALVRVSIPAIAS